MLELSSLFSQFDDTDLEDGSCMFLQNTHINLLDHVALKPRRPHGI
jgi:hypothetical protein